MPGSLPPTGPRANALHLERSSENHKVTLWTVQHAEVCEAVRRGRFRATLAFVPKSRRAATAWMCGEMARRGLAQEASTVPIWGFVSRPPERNDLAWGLRHVGDDMQLLRLCVPKHRLLLSWHFAWAYQFLSLFPEPFYLFSSEEERVRMGFKRPDEETCRNSWQRLFDLKQALHPDFSWWNNSSASEPLDDTSMYLLQATLPFVDPTDFEAVDVEW